MQREPNLPVAVPNASNLSFVEKLYYDYQQDPSSVGDPWRRYFDGLPRTEPPPPVLVERRRSRDGGSGESMDATEAFQARVDRLVHAYREYGHLRASLDPLGLAQRPHNGFPLEAYGLSPSDLDRTVRGGDPDGGGRSTLRDLLDKLEETYCRTLGVELAHLHDVELRTWLEERMERTRNHVRLDPDVQLRLLGKLIESESFEQFLGTRFLGSKRFSLEGGEGLVALLELAVDRAAGHGVKQIVIGMAHRGRLNVLANIIGKPLREIFAEFRDRAIVNGGTGGDVKYHLGYAGARTQPDGRAVELSLAFNPSHLEWIDGVVEGMVRARQDRDRDSERQRALPILIHGDAAFAGQGVVAEVLNLSELEGYSSGGTVHVVVDNQVGFTTSPRDARSSTYATDVARMLQIPVFHVNGEDVEAVAQSVLLAVDFRQRFHRDVVIDLWCYRKYGHNEGDEPSFTQPVMYRAISEKRSLPQEYADKLSRAGVIPPDRIQELRQAVHQRLETAFTESAAIAVSPGRPPVRPIWTSYHGGSIATAPEVATWIDPELLRRVGRRLVEVPGGFVLHPKLARILQARAEMAEGKRPVDWGMAELLAFGTLAWNGTRVRLSGQDSRRGTFSHRHGVLFDYQTGMPYLPIAHLRDGQGPVELRDSPLSEAGVLGFEYGYSLEMPEGLVIWEAQYGDFVNGAQVIVDQFIASAEAKWSQLSGLVLLLPHGMEGAGPEHSSARLERFLALAVDDNWQVIDPTTPAQYFHALRRQVLAPWRKPLVVMAPKSLLRHPQAISSEAELTSGRFQRILPDPGTLDPAEVTRVVLCSGRIFYDLLAAREASQLRHVAILRLEQLYPLREDELLRELARYPSAGEVVWAQDQPRNMGAWPYVDLRLAPLLRDELHWSCVSRPFSASPSAGSATRHKLEQDALVQQALGEPSARSARAIGAGRSND